MNATAIEAKLQAIDAMIEKTETDAEQARNTGNIERALFLEGKAKGLSDAHRLFSGLLDTFFSQR